MIETVLHVLANPSIAFLAIALGAIVITSANLRHHEQQMEQEEQTIEPAFQWPERQD